MLLSVFPAQDSENCLKQGNTFFYSIVVSIGNLAAQNSNLFRCFVNLSPVATCTSAQAGIRCTWLQNNQ